MEDIRIDLKKLKAESDNLQVITNNLQNKIARLERIAASDQIQRHMVMGRDKEMLKVQVRAYMNSIQERKQINACMIFRLIWIRGIRIVNINHIFP